MIKKEKTLLILFFSPAILAALNIDLLRIIGVLFAVCYIPGLVLVLISKKDMILFEDVVLSFPVSIGISSLTTLGLLYIGIHADFIVYIIYAFTGFILFSYVATYKKLPSLNVRLSPSEIRFLIAAVLMTLILSVPVFSDRIAISAHGFHHLSIVTRIINGSFPPENPGLGGTSIGYHWGYHSLIAALTYPANMNPLRIFSLLNILSLFIILCIAYRCAQLFGFSEGYCYLAPLALIGLMRSDAIIFLAQKLLSGNFPPIQNNASAPMNLLTSWVQGVSYLDTRLFFINKFYNANNMPLGICLIFSFLLILLLLLREQMKRAHSRAYLILLNLVLIALALNYAFFLIIPLLIVPVWAVVLFLTSSGSKREKWKEIAWLMAPCVTAALISAPYLYAITHAPGVITAGRDVRDVKFIYLSQQVIKNLIVFLLPAPLIITGLGVAFKRLRFSRSFLFLLSGTSVCMLLSIFLRLQWYNSAKFSFLLSFFFSILFIFAVHGFLSLLSSPGIKKVVVSFLVIYLLSTPLITEAAYLRSPWFSDDTYFFTGRHLMFSRNSSRNEAYVWVRNNTPVDALLILSYERTPFGVTIAQEVSYRPSAISERCLFVIRDVYAVVSPEYQKRVDIREQIFTNPKSPDVTEYLTNLNRPIYLFFEEGYADPLLEDVEADRIPENAHEKFVLVFQNDHQRVYRLDYANN